MKLDEIRKIVYSNYKVYINRKTIHGTVGYCRLTKSKSVEIVLDRKLKGRTLDLIEKHELGHIYLRHFDRLDKDADDVRKLYKEMTGKNLPLRSAYKIINICQDIVIHDIILDRNEVSYIESSLDFKCCTSDSFKAPPLLEYFEYYEYVIKELKERAEKSKHNNENNKDKQNGKHGDCGCPFGDDFDDEDDDFDDGDDVGIDNSIELPIEGEEPNGNQSDQSDSDVEKDGGILQTPPDDTELNKNNNVGNSDIQGILSKFSREEARKDLEEVLRKLILRKPKVTTSMSIDSFRKTERLRLKDGIFRKSLRLKSEKSLEKNAVTLCIDCSGSMYSVIQVILSTIDKCRDLLDEDSALILWDTRLEFEDKLKNVKPDIKFSMGGNDLTPAIRYCLDKYPNNKVVFISDYCEGHLINNLQSIIINNKDRIIGIRLNGGQECDKRAYDYDLEKFIF